MAALTKALLLAGALVLGIAAYPAAAQSWSYPGFGFDVAEKSRRSGYERFEAPREPRRAERRERDERREHAFTEDERRAFHRDIDKANRELYRRRGQ